MVSNSGYHGKVSISVFKGIFNPPILVSIDPRFTTVSRSACLFPVSRVNGLFAAIPSHYNPDPSFLKLLSFTKSVLATSVSERKPG